jgi:hypothetical protein
VPSDVLGKAIAPLHRCVVAEPELLLRVVGCVRAHAEDIDRVLCAALNAAPSLSMMSPVAVLEPKGPPDGRCPPCRRHCRYRCRPSRRHRRRQRCIPEIQQRYYLSRQSRKNLPMRTFSWVMIIT